METLSNFRSQMRGNSPRSKNVLELLVIVETNSDWSSSIVLVPKPDGSWRFCNNFHLLNKITKFNTMPCIEGQIDRLGTAQYIKMLDLPKGYWQIPLS